MRVHDIQRYRTLNIAILTPKDMMLLKLKDRKNKINFNDSIKTFFTTHMSHSENDALMAVATHGDSQCHS